MARQSTGTTTKKARLNRLQRFSLWFFHRPRKTALIWLAVLLFGAASYTTLLKREGFPSINTPFAIASGSYLVNNPAKVDSDVAQPLSQFLLKQSGVKSVQTQSFGNYYSAIVSYNDGVNANTASQTVSRAIASQHILPAQATIKVAPFEFGFTQRGDDLVIAFYSQNNRASTEDLVTKGKQAASFIKQQHLSLVQDVSVIDPFEQATNPLTGQLQSTQKTFDRFGAQSGTSANFYTSVVIGVKAEPGADNLKLDKQVRGAIDQLNQRTDMRGYHSVISASYAPQITQQINELQKTLLEGLAAVLVVGSLVIAIRASLITVLSMVSVLAITNGLLYLIGYSLNTITLFGLILGLSLIVDDTIIMVEALDAQRRRHTTADAVVQHATGRVGRAMLAATSTSVLSFAPLLFVTGILGSFIRAIPVTIISALLISLFVALVFIPMFARFVLLGKKQLGEKQVHEAAAGIEARIARFISGPMLWAKGSTKRLLGVGIVAMMIGFGFIAGGGFLFQKVTFNIFPPSKDSDQLSATITYHPDTSIAEAQGIADQVDHTVSQMIGKNFMQASYYGQATIQSAMLTIDITDYNSRSITAPQIADQLNAYFKHYAAADVKTGSLGVGPPAATFSVQINDKQNRAGALKLAQAVAHYLQYDAQLKRPNGKIARIDSVSVDNPSIYTRTDNRSFVAVTTTYIDSDTTTLVDLTKKAVQKQFPPTVVQGYGLPKDAINFDAGQEDQNQNSFKDLALAFPALLFVIYLVLALQFRSLLQPLLIFMALPFSLFGITLGLFLTNNAFSFFALLGFFALIGLSIKNTILLTDYANQARRAGMGTVDAAHEALAERFRPLIATSFTAVFSLIPLALSSPFWQGLSVVLIFGLLSSTFLVITVFPYYYLGAEFLRQRFNRRTGSSWFILTIALLVLCIMHAPQLAILAPLLAALVIKFAKKLTPSTKGA